MESRKMTPEELREFCDYEPPPAADPSEAEMLRYNQAHARRGTDRSARRHVTGATGRQKPRPRSGRRGRP